MCATSAARAARSSGTASTPAGRRTSPRTTAATRRFRSSVEAVAPRPEALLADPRVEPHLCDEAGRPRVGQPIGDGTDADPGGERRARQVVEGEPSGALADRHVRERARELSFVHANLPVGWAAPAAVHDLKGTPGQLI